MPYHHPPAATAIPSPNPPGLETGTGDLACNFSRRTHSIAIPPPKNYQSKSPQMISPLPNAHRLLGLMLAVWLVWGIRLLGDKAGAAHVQAHPTPTEREHHSHKRPWLLQIPGAQASSAKAGGQGSIANCLYSASHPGLLEGDERRGRLNSSVGLR